MSWLKGWQELRGWRTWKGWKWPFYFSSTWRPLRHPCLRIDWGRVCSFFVGSQRAIGICEEFWWPWLGWRWSSLCHFCSCLVCWPVLVDTIRILYRNCHQIRDELVFLACVGVLGDWSPTNWKIMRNSLRVDNELGFNTSTGWVLTSLLQCALPSQISVQRIVLTIGNVLDLGALYRVGDWCKNTMMSRRALLTSFYIQRQQFRVSIVHRPVVLIGSTGDLLGSSLTSCCRNLGCVVSFVIVDHLPSPNRSFPYHWLNSGPQPCHRTSYSVIIFPYHIYVFAGRLASWSDSHATLCWTQKLQVDGWA